MRRLRGLPYREAFMGKELEFKLAAADADELERVLEDEALAALRTGELQVYEMRSTYYDTPSGRFSERLYTVRRRMENDRSVLCVKAPVPGAALDAKLRGEWETEGEDIAAALPELVTLGAPADLLDAAQEGIIPVCGAAFRRRAVHLQLSDGSICELACDLGELFGRTQHMPLGDVELELKEGAPDETRRLAETLGRRFRLRPEPRSKYLRARGLR